MTEPKTTPEQQATVTISAADEINVGDFISWDELERRWWKRLWHFILRRDPPAKRKTCQVINKSGTLLDIHNGQLEV